MRFTAATRSFWWNAMMVFGVLRLADLLNAFTGLWVIPRGIAQDTLGALLPLTQFGALLALPLTILATVFTRQLCYYLSVGEVGCARRLLRDTLRFTLLAFCLALGGATIALPWVCQHLRIPLSLAGYCAVAYGLLAAFLPMGLAALQATKQFGALAVGSALASPARLIAMLCLLPALGLTGYFLGQILPMVVTLCVVGFVLRSLFKGEQEGTQKTWFADLKPILRYAGYVALGVCVNTFYGLILTFVIRHALPEQDSAAYYLISRFAEITTYCGSTLWMILFPFAVESQARGTSVTHLRNGVFGVILLGGLLLAGLFAWGLPWLFKTLPTYQAFLPYTSHAVYLTVITTLTVACTAHFQYATARNNFRYLCYTLPIALLTAAGLWLYPWNNLMEILHLLALSAVVQTLCVGIDSLKMKRSLK